jgi:hypothetical protein
MDGLNPALNPLAQLQQMQSESYQRNKEQVGRVQKEAARSEEDDATERWANMAVAASKVPPVSGNFGAMLASIGGAYGQTLNAQEQRRYDREKEITGLIDKGSGGMLGAGSMTAMTQAALNPFVNVPGVGLVQRSSAEVKLPSNMIPEYNKLYSQFYKSAVENKMPNPEEWAKQQATTQLQSVMGSPQMAGGRATQVAPEPFNGQSAAPAAPQTSPLQQAAEVDIRPAPGANDASAWIAQLKKEEQEAVVVGDYARATQVQEARMALEKKAKTAPPQGLQYRDKPVSEMEEATAKKVGENLGNDFVSYQTASANSSELKNQLQQLKTLYSNPNMPEGQLATGIQGIRSSLKSLGVDVGPEVGAADMAQAIAGKMALLTRTEGGTNLMPGAMTDFEQRILQSLVPGLNQTAEGRAALIDYLGDMADVRIRMAAAAQKAAGDRGILKPDWYKQRDRLLKEEQARLVLKSRELNNRFKVK